jgi:hypothetical protein
VSVVGCRLSANGNGIEPPRRKERQEGPEQGFNHE